MGTLKYVFQGHPAETIAQWQWGAFQMREREQESMVIEKNAEKAYHNDYAEFSKQPTEPGSYDCWCRTTFHLEPWTRVYFIGSEFE